MSIYRKIVFIIASVIVFVLIYINYHPIIQTTFDNADKCQAYRIDRIHMIKIEDQRLERTTIISGKLLGDEWIIGKPTICSSLIKDSVVKLLHNKNIYGKARISKSRYGPHYAFRLSNNMGNEIIMIDVLNDWFSIYKFDHKGRLIIDMGILEEHGNWLRILKQTYPNDPEIISAIKLRGGILK